MDPLRPPGLPQEQGPAQVQAVPRNTGQNHPHYCHCPSPFIGLTPAQALGDGAFSFQFEGSEMLDTLIGSDTMEAHPDRYTEHCWNVENRCKS